MKINTVTNIELSAICNNTCQYCPAPTQHKYRSVGTMTMEIFQKSIEVIGLLQERKTQRELNLYGIGESTLNPLLIDMIKYARKNLPYRQILHMNTNGKTMTKDIAKQIKEAGINHVDITAHNLQITTICSNIFKEVGILHNISFDPLLHPNNWANQVDWYSCGENYTCPWLTRGQVMIYWDGRITSCCVDSKALGVIGNINNDIDKLELKKFSLCEKCNQNKGII